jgi:hypothetical protein
VISIQSGRRHSEKHHLTEVFQEYSSPFKIIRQKIRKEIYEIALIAKDSFPQSAVTTVFSRLGAQYNYLAGEV